MLMLPYFVFLSLSKTPAIVVLDDVLLLYEEQRERESCTDTTEFIVGQIFALPQPMRDEVKPKTEEP